VGSKCYIPSRSVLKTDASRNSSWVIFIRIEEPMAYRGLGLLPGWMDKAASCQNPGSPHIIRGWRSGDMVHHPVWFILSYGPICTTFRGMVFS
jgi:hypothetical protein